MHKQYTIVLSKASMHSLTNINRTLSIFDCVDKVPKCFYSKKICFTLLGQLFHHAATFQLDHVAAKTLNICVFHLPSNDKAKVKKYDDNRVYFQFKLCLQHKRFVYTY